MAQTERSGPPPQESRPNISTASVGQPWPPVDMLAAALRYAAAGWPVFPCQPGAKAPLTPNGFKNATTDPAIIAAWWSRSPRANVAVATGAPGPDVLDVDTKNGLPGMALFTDDDLT